MAGAEAGGRRYQYLYEWRARLETGLGRHADADASLVIGRDLACDAGSQHGVFRMDVARAEAAIAAAEFTRAEQLLAGLRGDGDELGPVTAERRGAVIAWLRGLRFADRPQPNLALVRVETALTLADLWAERGKYRSALALVAAIDRDLPAAEIAIRIDQVRLLEIDLSIEAGELAAARDRLTRLPPAGPSDEPSDRARIAVVHARLDLASGDIADAARRLDDLAAAPAGDPSLWASATAARIAILAELNLWDTASAEASRAIEQLGADPAAQPLIDLLTRARTAARARGRSVHDLWERANAPRGARGSAAAEDDAELGELLRLDAPAAAPARFTARWTRHANAVIVALERGEVAGAAVHQAALDAATQGAESSYVTARARLSAALVAYAAEPAPATCEALQAIAGELHAIGARGAEAQALRYAAWSAAKQRRVDDYVALARRATAILEAIAGELPPVLRTQYLLNKWNGRDEYVAGRMRELPHDDATGEITATRREKIAAFREIELITRWPVDRAFGERGAEQLLHETSDAHARWVRELQAAAASQRRLRGFTLRSPLSLWRLPRRTLVLHYHVLPDRTYLFRMARGHIDVRALPIGRLQLQRDMHAAASDPAQLAELAEHTGIAEARADFPRARRLVIVPHDAIAGVPFAALPVRGVPLCAQVAIAQIDRLERLQRRGWFHRIGSGVAIGLGDYRGTGERDLAAAEPEATAVAAALGGAALTGDGATCDAMTAAMRGAAWIHVAAHGATDAADPASSGIVLRHGAGHRILALRELRQIAAPELQLVTLATCRSADAAVLPGGARICIPSALLDAGARGVIAALWPIDDAPSVEVMTALAHRLRRERPSVALAGMQAELSSRPARHWAGLVFYGND
jgi:hypothetical protein